MAVPTVHRVRARPERLALAAAVRSISSSLAVNDIRSNGEHALCVRRIAVGWVLSYLPHEAGDDVRRDLINAVVVVAEVRRRLIPLILIVDHQSCRIAGHAD